MALEQETLYLTWDSLVTCFEQELETKQDKDEKLKGYIKKFTQFDFVATIHMFMLMSCQMLWNGQS